MENNVGLSGWKKAVALFKWSLRKNLPFSIAYWILLFLSFPMIEIFAMIVCGKQLNLGMESFIKDMKDYQTINKLYVQKFKKPYPARTCVAVKDLPIGTSIEFEMIAYRG